MSRLVVRQALRLDRWLLLVILGATGCSTRDADRKEQAPDAIAVVRSAKLFRGDTERIEPHLGLITSGCCEVEWKDRAGTLQPTLQVWKNGQAQKPMLVGKTSLPVDEVSISLKDGRNADDVRRLEVTVVLRGPRGYVAYRDFLDKPTSKKASGTPITLPRATPIQEGQPTPVWGFMMGKGTDHVDGAESIQDMAKRVEWALVLSVTPVKVEKK